MKQYLLSVIQPEGEPPRARDSSGHHERCGCLQR